MKKLMIVAAIAFTTVASQAACCSWSYKCSTANTELNGAKVYTILGATAATSFASVAEITSAAVANATTGKKATDTSYKTSPKFSSSASGSINDSSLTKAAPNFYFVIVNGDQSGYSISEVFDATAYLYEPGGSASQTLAFSPSSVAFTKFSSGDVPEPTSAMLLLLGVAGLALRRKQA